jgi:hypothetical protein
MFAHLDGFLNVIGFAFTTVGVLLLFFNNIPLIGKLPGDILIKKENFTFYAPITSTILITFFLSLVFQLIKK